jgi:hypothetical protein
VLAGLWIAGCGLFDFSAPEHAADNGGAGADQGGTETGGSSGASGTTGGSSGTAGDSPSGGAGGDTEQGGTSGSAGAAGAGDGGAGSSQGGTAGTPAGGTGGDGGTSGQGPTLRVTQGLRLWLDAASLAGAGPISTWPNRAAGESDATQPLSTRRPILGTVDSHPGVTFDGNRWMTFGEGFEDFSAGLTFFLVARFDAPGICTEIFQVSNGQEVDDISVQSDVMLSDPGVLLFEVSNANVGTDPGVLGGTNLMLATIVVGPPEDASISIDGITARSGEDPLFVPATVSRSQNFLGSGLYLNCDPFQGVIFELLLYNRTLSTEDTALVNGYLEEKWNCCGG